MPQPGTASPTPAAAPAAAAATSSSPSAVAPSDDATMSGSSSTAVQRTPPRSSAASPTSSSPVQLDSSPRTMPSSPLTAATTATTTTGKGKEREASASPSSQRSRKRQRAESNNDAGAQPKSSPKQQPTREAVAAKSAASPSRNVRVGAGQKAGANSTGGGAGAGGGRSPKGAASSPGTSRAGASAATSEATPASPTKAGEQNAQAAAALGGAGEAGGGETSEDSFTSLVRVDTAMEDMSGDTSGSSTSSLPGAFSYHTDSSVGLQQSSTVSRGAFHQCGTARRVKVYELQGEVWHDRGTGFCAGVYDEGHDEALLVARSEDACAIIPLAKPEPAAQQPANATPGAPATESTAEEEPQHFVLVVTPTLDGDDVLLKTTVVREDVYQRQQDTLVVWTEPTGVDMALSFQEAEGCHEIWEFLTEVQKHFMINGANIGVDGAMSDSPPLTPNAGSSPGPGGHGMGPDSLVMADGAPFYLPDPQLGNLELVEVTLKDAASRGPQARERVANWMLKSGFLSKLIPVFNDAEDLEQLPALHHLCSITQTALMLNDHALLDNILHDDVFLGVVGMLEYDPEFPRLKANYRDFLQNTTKFRSVVDISDPLIVTKIHQTYRLSYLKDVILARVLDDPMFSVLNSFIFFHQVDIVGFCSSNEAFLRQLFSIYGVRHGEGGATGGPGAGAMKASATNTEEDDADVDEATVAARDHKREEGVIFLQQLCAMGKQVQLPARIALYRTLVEWGLLSVLEWALQRPSSTRLRNAAAEVLLTIIEYDANSVRGHCLAQNEAEKRPLSEMLIACLHDEVDLGLKTQMAEAMRVLLDTGLEGTAGGGSAVAQTLAAAAASAAGGRPKDEADHFLTFFYDNGVERLFAPLFTLPTFKEVPAGTSVDLQPRARSALYGHLCDLLCYVMANHTFRSQYFVITSEIALRVAALLFAREKHMRLAALRFFRACLARNNQFINRHFVKTDLLGAVIEMVEREEKRDNLVTAACLDFFFAIRKENMKPLIANVMDKYGERVKALAKAPVVGTGFSLFVLQHEKNSEPLPASSNEAAASGESERQRRQRDLARRGANRATMDADEESYFNDDRWYEETTNKTQRKDKAGGQGTSRPRSDATAKAAAAGTSPSKQWPLTARTGLVTYADDDADADAETDSTMTAATAAAPPAEGSVASSDAAQASGEPAAPATESVIGLSFPQKRRRSDDAEENDVMTRLAKRKSISSDADEEGGFVREPAAGAAADKPVAAQAQGSATGIKKVKISIGALSSKKLGAAAATAPAPAASTAATPATDAAADDSAGAGTSTEPKPEAGAATTESAVDGIPQSKS